MSVATVDWYDYPEYYEMAFADETEDEADFVEAACKKYVEFPVRRMFEPGCGGGRLVFEMGQRGYYPIGLDNNKKMLAYFRGRLKRHKIEGEVINGDMTDFDLPEPADIAMCTFNTFRHLLTEQAAIDHLQSVARNLRLGGIYILGLHLLPLDVDLESEELWEAKSGKTEVEFDLRVISASRRARKENICMTVQVKTPKKNLKMKTEFSLRMYTASQFRRTLHSVPAFELCDVYDFCYEIDEPLEFDDIITDTVFILKRV